MKIAECISCENHVANSREVSACCYWGNRLYKDIFRFSDNTASEIVCPKESTSKEFYNFITALDVEENKTWVRQI